MRLELVLSGLRQTKVSDSMTEFLLAVGFAALTYEAVSKIVNQVASETFDKKRMPLLVSTLSFAYVSTMELPKLQAHFAGICVFYIVMSIWVARKASSTATFPDYMIDMVAEAKSGAYISKIGYEDALMQVEVLMNKSTKSNALLLAKPGVGKSTIPETIAHKIATAQYPSRSPFFEAKLIQVDFTDLMAGTIYRGSLEKRIQEMVQLAEKDPKIIYFIDEIHNLVGGGKTIESRVDISEMLKKAMARGKIRIISASTKEDYKNYIKPKGPFARRLPPVKMLEPPPAKCFEMLQHSYSQMQGRIKISDEAIKAAIVFSKDIPDRYFPDKAIDLIDNAISHAELELDDTKNETLSEFHIAAAKSASSQQKGGELLDSFWSFLGKNPDYFPG
jgi:ATP-dependent Clp protease ATP-binding subunit ClpA